ncbi:MAG TPA: hypothetical protein VMB34_32410 [Acetobacteraceae bacterium]|nr:hypothetical protein [Acetobacteraceae bacterium]
MLLVRRFWLALAVIQVAAARADESPRPAPLERTSAFETAYAASFYQFDACGDGIAGNAYRSALVNKLKRCPFSDAAKAHFMSRLAAQRRKSAAQINKLIETNGGLPVQLAGMTRTCREQMDSPKYRELRRRLDAYSAGKLKADGVVAQPCDAAEIEP